MISNGSNIPLNQNSGTLPDVSGAMQNWFQVMTFTTIVKSIVNFQVVETPTLYTYKGVIQPFTPQQLQMKPEGQRSWVWFTIHAEPALSLAVDEVVTYLSVQYRVKSKSDYSKYGYAEYHVIQDFTGSGP